MPPDLGAEELDELQLLEQYLEALHAGRTAERDRLLAAHPELAAMLNCLDVLHSFACAPAAEPQRAGSLHGDATQPPSGRAAAANAARGDELPDTALHDSQAPAASNEPHSEASPSAAAANRFGPYELIAEVGRGGMGVVYKARDSVLDRVVAIKMILSSHLATADVVRRFYAEAKAAARFKHPHIVGIHEVGQLHGQHYCAMEYVAGRSLAHELQSGPMPAKAAAECLAKVARAVDHLHHHGIVHRDLKPSNILLDEQGEPRVSDFGLVKMLQSDSRMTSTGAIVGTPSYMAPEQASGRAGEVGPLSDVYSLGAILFEMLTGRPPFRADTPLDTLVQVLEGEPKRPSLLNPQVPRELELICLRCLEKNRVHRYASAAALADDLDRFLADEPVEARGFSVWQQLRRWARREPALVSRLAALTLIFLIVQLKYQLAPAVTLAVHLEVTVAIVVWTLACVVFQRLLNRERWAEPVRVAWLSSDVVFLTALIQITDSLVSADVVNYGLLVAGSGLWFRVRLVWLTAAICEVAYGLLVLDASQRGLDLGEPHRHVIFAVSLAVLSFVVAYQVKRVRALSRYYESRPMP